MVKEQGRNGRWKYEARNSQNNVSLEEQNLYEKVGLSFLDHHKVLRVLILMRVIPDL